MHCSLLYDVVPDYHNRRMVLRAVHLAHAKIAQVSGRLLLGGALGDSVDGEALTKYKGSPS
jgi:hypothetical protein